MKQILAISVFGLILLVSLLVFGKTSLPKKDIPSTLTPAATFNVTNFVNQAKQKLSSSQLIFINRVEHSISRGDVKQQSVRNFQQMADFWKDSAKAFVPYAYYTAEAAKLDNSEKNLTFAAQLFLDSLRGEDNETVKVWESENAIDLYNRALALDPENDSLKLGLGSCYVYGKGMIGDAAETMKGIQQLLQVIRKDSGNMKAQMVLGIGGVISRQYDKAIIRLLKVANAEPANLEAVSWLADAYAATGDNVNAVKWYEYSKKLVNNTEYSKEVDERIKALRPPNH
jgi:tetratricopeptide (TPR) repeat protein